MTAWIPDVVPDEPIESAWGNTIRNRTITPFANAAARTTAIPAPVAGMATWIVDRARVEVHNGSAWIPVPPETFHVPFGYEPLSGSFIVAGEQSFGAPAFAYRMVVELGWTAFAGGGGGIALHVHDMTGALISPPDFWHNVPTGGSTHASSFQFVTAIRNAGVVASIRVRAAANVGAAGVRSGLAKVTIIPATASSRPGVEGPETDRPTIEPHNETENE